MIQDAIFCMKEIAGVEVCENCQNYDRCDHMLIEENARYAIEALEKQMQKKPVLKWNAYGGICVCPICGASDYGKYCRWCGQKIN